MAKKSIDKKIIELFPKFQLKSEFLQYALKTLGYIKDEDFTEENIVQFATDLGLETEIGEELNDAAYELSLYSMLAAKMKNGRNCFEVLAEEGKFDVLNENKEIPEIVVFDGKTQPVFDYKECLFEKVFVETPLDTDNDGKRDLIAVYIRRPKETLKGMKVPAIYVADPYMLTCIDEWYENMPNVDLDLKVFEDQNITAEDVQYKGRERKLPLERESKGEATTSETEEITLDCITAWYNYFNSRGFASVYSAGVGTKGSEGMNCCGSEEEKIWVIAVIEWLCGKRKAYTNKTDNIEIKADWCNGKVAMSGKSYLGTLSIAAASTGVEGLKTIIPEAAISSWYNYYHGNGLNMAPVGWQGDDADLLTGHCRSRDLNELPHLNELADDVIQYLRRGMDRENGNYNSFWDERNYLKDIKNMKASAFIVHGINDWNVKTIHSHLFWKEMEKYNIPKKMILHQGDHIYIHDLKGIDFNDIMNRWLSHWLYDIDNNVMEEVPEVLIQDNLDIYKWHTTYAGDQVEYFIDNSKKLTRSGEKSASEVVLKDDIDSTKFDREKKNFEEWQKDMILDVEEKRDYRLVYLTAELEDDLRVSGDITVEIEAATDSETGILSTMLVDLGEDRRATVEQYKTGEKNIYLGKNGGYMEEKDFVIEKEPSPFKIISRGSINIQNRENNYCKKSVEKDRFYKYTFNMVPTDYTIRKGHRMELVILGSDVEITTRPKKVTDYRVKEDSLKLRVPLIIK